jgi:flagellar hook protein FlgE
MSLYGMMKTGVSGMQAQSNRLGTVADNIANSNTTGYKRATVQFSSLVIPNEPGTYSSGGVKTTVRNAISQQGVLQFTTSSSDLAISGQGFFVVQDSSGPPFLLRAGSFVPDGAGRLVNAAGFFLTGYNYANGTPSAVANGFNGLEVVSIADFGISASPSTEGTMHGNLPSGEPAIPAADLPSTNSATATPTKKSSFVVRDNLGNELLMDVYFTKTANNQWEVAIYDQSDAAPNTSFPYTAPAVAVETLDFDPLNGRLLATSADSISFNVPGGQPVTMSLASFSQLATGFSATTSVDGNAPSEIEEIQISADGIVSAQYGNGSVKALYRIPLANVQSPDQLSVLPGNVYAQSADSGEVRIGFPGEASFGSVVSGALEGSNVDIANELTDMIEAQRNYTANSKVFQTGSDLLDILVNLKR